MRQRFLAAMAECLIDLAVVVAYAAVAGVLIAAIAYSDGPTSVLSFIVYALSLPLGVLVLITAVAAVQAAVGHSAERRTHA